MRRVVYLLLMLVGPSALAQAPARFAAVTPHGLATEVAMGIMRAGGTAADAAVAAQMVLGVVMPDSSGIGGGGLALSYDSASRTVISCDGRETAPVAAAAALPGLLQAPPSGGRAAGIPRLLTVLQALQQAGGEVALGGPHGAGHPAG